MKFGPASPTEAIGGVTVHTLRQGSLVLKKGTTIGHAEVEALTTRRRQGNRRGAAGGRRRLRGRRRRQHRAGRGRRGHHMSSAPLPAAPICSRRRAGVLVVDRAKVDRINGVDEAITFATLAAYKPVVEGEMVATVKLIPFGVEAKLRDAAVEAAGRRRAADRALCHQARRHRLDLAAGAGAEGGGEDAAGDRRSGWRRPAPPSSPSAACRMTRRRCKPRSRNCSGSARSS